MRTPSFIEAPADPIAEARVLKFLAEDPAYIAPQLWSMPTTAFVGHSHAALYQELIRGHSFSAWATELAARIWPKEPTSLWFWTCRDRVHDLWMRREARRHLAIADELLLDPASELAPILAELESARRCACTTTKGETP